MELEWIKGRRIALCEPDPVRFQLLSNQLRRFGLEVYGFNSVKAVAEEIEKRHYSTHRFYLVIMIDAGLAQQVEQTWVSITGDNPSILETPVVLMREQAQLPELASLVVKGYFRFQLTQPITEACLLDFLVVLNRWKRAQYELTEKAEAAAKLSRE